MSVTEEFVVAFYLSKNVLSFSWRKQKASGRTGEIIIQKVSIEQQLVQGMHVIAKANTKKSMINARWQSFALVVFAAGGELFQQVDLLL